MRAYPPTWARRVSSTTQWPDAARDRGFGALARQPAPTATWLRRTRHPIYARQSTSALSGTEGLEAEDALLRQLPKLPDLQCAWLLLSFCAAPRASHVLRTVPPDLNAPYATAHDAAVWGTLQACLGTSHAPLGTSPCPGSLEV